MQPSTSRLSTATTCAWRIGRGGGGGGTEAHGAPVRLVRPAAPAAPRARLSLTSQQTAWLIFAQVSSGLREGIVCSSLEEKTRPSPVFCFSNLNLDLSSISLHLSLCAPRFSEEKRGAQGGGTERGPHPKNKKTKTKKTRRSPSSAPPSRASSPTAAARRPRASTPSSGPSPASCETGRPTRRSPARARRTRTASR